MSDTIITRESYLKGEASHAEYYAQFRCPQIEAIVKRHFLDLCRKSGNEYFNDVPLVMWDNCYGELHAVVASTNKRIGNGHTAAKCDIVSALKACARAMLDEELAEKKG